VAHNGRCFPRTIQSTIQQISELSLFPLGPLPKKIVQKRKAHPKRSIDKPGADHDLGLWIDYERLRKHQGRPPEILIQGPTSATNNRYLELADLALGTNKPKKK